MSRGAGQAKPAAERQRQPTEIRRLLIVDAAREVIAERGLAATTMRDIAHAAEVSVGTLTYHFSGIAEILHEVLDREMALFYEPAIDKAREAGRGSDGLHLLVEGFFAGDARTRQHWRLWLDFWSVSAHDEQYADLQREIYLRWRDDVSRMFAQAADQDELPVDRLEDAVSDFLALFDGSAVQAFRPRTPIGPDEARKHLTGWLRRVMADPPKPSPRRTTPEVSHP